MYTVYEHKNKINGKIYIGITKQSPEKRWGIDGKNYKSSPHFYAAIQKYGWDNFEHFILFYGLTKEEACAKEKELIAFYHTMNRNFGYNSTTGGDICEMHKDVKEKISKAMKGNRNGLGHSCSIQKKNKIANAQKGRNFTQEHKNKLSKAAKNRHTPCSEAKKEKLKNSYPKKRKVYCEELNKIFDSVQECSRALGIPATNIAKLCKGRGKTLKGYHLKYYDTINA